MNYLLPTSVEIDGVEYRIRSDYRAILDICTALSDPDLEYWEKCYTACSIFYADDIPKDVKKAVEECFRFINMGQEDTGRKKPVLMDWEQDLPFIIAPVNRVAGTEIRALEYLHWWTFLSYFYEIGGDCTFAQIVSVRSKLNKGTKLDKVDKEWLRDNPDLVRIKRKYSTSEKELLKQWGSGNGGQ